MNKVSRAAFRAAADAAAADAEPAEMWIPAQHVADRFDCIIKTIENWMRDEELGFPRPKKLRGRRYFRLSEIKKWESQFADRFGAKEEARSKPENTKAAPGAMFSGREFA